MDENQFLTLRSSGSSSGFSSARPQTSSLVFTLPVSCQICLSKVKDPVICSNRHVFCKQCMDVWLQRNQQCPACRVAVTAENPCRSILGGLSVTESDEESDAHTEARNSKKNLRKARIELLFNEYEEEIEELRHEAKDLTDKNKVLGDALRDAQSASSKVADNSTPRDSQTSAMLLGLTAKLQEANETYQKVLKDMELLKEQNSNLKSVRDHLEMDLSRVRSRLQLRSPAKIGRYTTAALESEVASTRQEMERLKKALAQADATVERMEQENESLRAKYQNTTSFQRPDETPTNDATMKAVTSTATSFVTASAATSSFNAPALLPPATTSSSTSFSLTTFTNSPSTSLRLLSLQSPSKSNPHEFDSSKCSRNLFQSATKPKISVPESSLLFKSSSDMNNLRQSLSTTVENSEVLSSSSRFSLPSDTTPIINHPNIPLFVPCEEESEVDVSLEPDMQDCLSLMHAAERNVRSRRELSQSPVTIDLQSSLFPSVPLLSRGLLSPSSSSGTNSTFISLALTSSSLGTSDSREPSIPDTDSFLVPSRCNSLKREISQAELSPNKAPKL